MGPLRRRRTAVTPEGRLEFLRLAAAAALASRREEEVGRVLDIARGALDADAYAFWHRADDGAWRAVAKAGLSDRHVQETTTRIAAKPMTDKPLLLEGDASSLPDAHRAFSGGDGMASALVVPLLLQGQTRGTLAFYYRKRRAFSSADVEAASLAVNLAASVIVNAARDRSGERDAARHRALGDDARDVVARVSPKGVLRDVSPAVRSILGHEPAEMVGTLARAHLHPQDAARLRDASRQEIELDLGRVRCRHKEGGWVQFEGSVRSVRDGTGEVAEYVASLRDVTHRTAQARALPLHQRVLESMVEGVTLADEHGVIVYTNPAGDRMFGYERGELIGEHVAVLNAHPREESERIVQQVIEQLRTRGAWDGEFQNVRKDGSRFLTRARITALTIDDEPHWLCVQEDVTVERTLEAREKERVRTLKTLHRVQGELASSLDVEHIAQTATDAATTLTGAALGAFFYDLTDTNGEQYTLHKLGGVLREGSVRSLATRDVPAFSPTFRCEAIVRSDDVSKDVRFARDPPFRGLPEGHPRVRSFLAVPVVGRGGAVHGGLYFGHPEAGRFDQVAEELASGIAAQTAVALDNAHLYRLARESERRMREREAQLAQAQAIAHLGSWKLDLATEELEWSDEQYRIHGLEPGSPIDLDAFRATLHPLDRGSLDRAISDARDAPSRQANREYRIVRPDGTVRFVHARLRIEPREGEPRTIMSTALDVTGRKKAESALFESEQRFRTLVTATTQMVWTTDAAGRPLDMPEWRAFTGQSEAEIKGDGWVAAIHPDDRARTFDAWTRAFSTRGAYHAEYRVRRHDGEYRHFEARAVPRADAEGKLIEYIGTWTDVTDRKRIVEEAEALRAQLIHGEKLAALGQLVSGVAHELRTPLTYLNNNAFLARHRIERLAREGALSDDVLRELDPYLDEITSGVDRINALVSDLRRYTKARSDPAVASLDLVAVALDAVELFRAANRGVHVVQTRFDPTRPIRANVGGIQQLLLNLLQNAAEAGPQGRPIRVATRDVPEGVVLEVSDEGPGIPPEIRDRMFEPLYTTKPEGTGLGLSIVKRIVDEHHGRIECDSRAGKGTTFRVTLPAS